MNDKNAGPNFLQIAKMRKMIVNDIGPLASLKLCCLEIECK